MHRRQANPAFHASAQEAGGSMNVMAAKTSQSLQVVLRRARATGVLELCDRRLRELPPQSYAPTPDDLDPDEKFWEIVELRALDASVNGIEELPTDWRGVGTLRQLRLGRNRLSAVPDAVLGDLELLETLDVGDNELRALPNLALGRRLKELKAPRNRLERFDAAAFRDCPCLEALDVGGNVDLGALPRLPPTVRKLDAENCGLVSVDRLPDELRTLVLAKNRAGKG